MPRLVMRLLDSTRIEVDGAPIEVDTRKATALLVYLAVTGDCFSREALAALLWPEHNSGNARAALRRTLSTLNKALGGDWLLSDREGLALRRGPDLSLDVDDFHSQLALCRAHGHRGTEICPVCLEPLAAAAVLYRADFLSGFTLRDSPAFDDWQFFQTESLRRELAGALDRLSRCHAERGDLEAAAATARRWLALDPLHEPAHRRLMHLYSASGQRTAALRQYRECVRVLDQDLGVPPLEETTRLYETIRGQRGDATPPPSGPAGEGLPPSVPVLPSQAPVLPLVGRAAEWAALLVAHASIGGDGRLIVLEGEAGIGKTRLAETLIEQARRRGARTLSARCYEGESQMAYGPWVEALRGAVARADSGLESLPAHVLVEASRLLPELAAPSGGAVSNLPPPAPLDSPGAQVRFFEAIHRVVQALCAPPPGVSEPAASGILFLDDAHWADEASLDLLTFLVRRLKGGRLCLLLTWRSEAVTVEHRLRRLLAEAERAGTATTLRLSRLEPSAVLELVRAVVPPAPPDPSSAHRSPERLAEALHRESEGLPYFLAEYLTVIARGGPQSDWALPQGARALLQSRLAAVDEAGWQLLNTAAVIGRSFDFDILREASGRSEEEAVTALEALVAHGLIHEVGEREGRGAPAYDFGHDKLRALVLEETGLARRRLLHRRVAEALAGRRRGSRDEGALASQVAQHFQLAGIEREAALHFKLAGDHARGLYANAEALAHYRSALTLGHPEPTALHEAIGDLQTLSGDYSAALASFETAAARRRGDAPALAALERKLGQVHHRRGEWELAESHFRSALAELGEAGFAAERSRLHSDWSLTAHCCGHAQEAQTLAEGSLGLATQAGDPQALAQAHNILGILASHRGELEAAGHHLERSLRLAEASGDSGARAATLNNLALAHGTAGDLGRALALSEEALGLCAARGDRHREAALHNSLADWLHAASRTEEAMAHLKQAVTIFAEIGAEAGDWQPEIWKLTEW